MSDKKDDVAKDDAAVSTDKLIDQINNDIKKKERDAAKQKMSAVVGEIHAAQKLIRVKTAELQKMQADFDAGIL